MRQICQVNITCLSEALQKLLELVRNKEDDVLFIHTMEHLKETYMINNRDPEVSQILKDLTLYAAKLQIWELTTIPSAEELAYYKSTDHKCNCEHNWSYELPCRHIYEQRRRSGSKAVCLSKLIF